MILLSILIISFLFASLGSLILWLNIAFLIDGILHATWLAEILFNAFDISATLAVLIVLFILLLLLYILNDFSNTNLIISTQTITVLAAYFQNVNFQKTLFGNTNFFSSFSYFSLTISVAIATIILYNRQYFLKSIILHDIQLNYSVKPKFHISIEYIIVSLVTIFLIQIISIGFTNMIALFLIPSLLSYQIAKNSQQMVIISFVVTATVILIGYYSDISFISLILFSSYFILKLCQKFIN